MTSATAYWIAAARARESARPDRLFDDPFAHTLAGARGYEIMAASERVSGQENQFIPVRVRWFDDTIAALVEPGWQVVLLGAGLDTRPYRLALPADLDWFELDRPDVFAAKEPALAGQVPRCRRHPVVGDVAEEWGGPLRSAGFDPARPTCWVAEGLLFYLSEPTILAMLRSCARLSAPGSRFLADLFPASVIEQVGAYAKQREKAGAPPPFGHDDPDTLFAAGGWAKVEASPPGAPEANFGRLPRLPAGARPGHAHLVTASLS